METLTRQEIEMCQLAVAIVTDTRDLTDENKAKWDMLWEKLEVMQKEESRPTQAAPDAAKSRRQNVVCPECETLFAVELSPNAAQVENLSVSQALKIVEETEGSIPDFPESPEDLLVEENTRMEAALEAISAWAEAYPLVVFPEPDFKKVRELLEAGGISLASVSASNMRHVVQGVARLAREGLGIKTDLDNASPNQLDTGEGFGPFGNRIHSE